MGSAYRARFSVIAFPNFGNVSVVKSPHPVDASAINEHGELSITISRSTRALPACSR